MSINNWYVITGSSCSGKTTLVNMLEQKGYKVVYETARTLLDQELSKGLTVEEIRKDENAFQKKILDMKIDVENNLDKQDFVFLDRAIPDTCAYYTLYGVSSTEALDEAIKKCNYKKVFLLDQLPYTLDYARTETKEQQDKLHELLEKAYRDLGFEIVQVPVLPIEERVEFVLKHL